jgi:hypothetical protein
VLFEALHAAESLGGDVMVVGPDVDHAIVLYVDFEPAERLADTAKGVFRLRHAVFISQGRSPGLHAGSGYDLPSLKSMA